MSENKTEHGGQERRRRRMYVTQNSEYHFRDSHCIAVRDRNAGTWLLAHRALDREASGSIRRGETAEPFPCLEMPRVGDALFFGTTGPDVITSVVSAVKRPERTIVQNYPF